MTKFAPLLLPRYKRYDITNQNIPGNFLILHATTVLRKSEIVGEKTVGSSWPDPGGCGMNATTIDNFFQNLYK